MVDTPQPHSITALESTPKSPKPAKLKAKVTNVSKFVKRRARAGGARILTAGQARELIAQPAVRDTLIRTLQDRMATLAGKAIDCLEEAFNATEYQWQGKNAEGVHIYVAVPDHRVRLAAVRSLLDAVEISREAGDERPAGASNGEPKYQLLELLTLYREARRVASGD